MPAKVFISCGQREGERQIAAKIAEWLKEKEQGFVVYVAKERQTLQDVNNGIIGELATSDYYLMIDFQRELITGNELIADNEYRGSLFTHQEMALAYYMGYNDHFIALRHEQVKLEGIAGFLLANAKTFRQNEDVFGLVKDEVKGRGWSHTFSRQLIVDAVSPGPKAPFRYLDHTGDYFIKPWYGYIKNCRRREAAVNTIVRLHSMRVPGSDPKHPDSAILKWAGQMGYECAIFPEDSKSFSLFHIDAKEPARVFLASAADSHPREPIINSAGIYILKYQVLATAFPLLEFSVKLTHTADIDTVQCELM